MPNQQIIDDPFSSEFMETANKEMQTIHVSAASLRKRRVRQDKFVLHPDLKKRLIKLISTNVPEQVKAIAQQIIDLTHVPTLNKYCNYLGLSQADYTKISYLDEDRKNRLNGQVGIQHIIKPGTEAVFHYKRNYVSHEPNHGHYDCKLVLTARHLGGDVFPIKGFVLENKEFTVTSYLWENSQRTQNEHVFNFEFKNTFLEKDSRPLRIRNSRLVSSASFHVDQSGYEGTGGYNLLGVSFNKTETKVKEVWNYKQRYHTSVGKIVRRLFGDTYSDRDITAFAEAYASLITVSNPLYDFAIIDGDAIKDAYHFENYAAQSGTLGSSCMRHRSCQNYFDIYTKFPDKVRMAVLKRGGKIAARSIMWNIEGKFMFDRIYYTTNETQNLLKNTLEAAGYSTLFSVGRIYSMEIDLEGINKFPYLDTLCNYDLARKILTNGCIDGLRYEFRNTGGDYYQYNCQGEEEDSDYTCSCCDNTVHYDTTIYVERGQYRDLRVCEDCAIYSDSTGEYHTIEDDTVITYQDDSILTDEGIRLIDDRWAHQDDPELRQFENGFGYFILDEHDYLTDGNVYYYPNDETKPENLYDSEEVNRRNSKRLSEIITNNSIINIHSSSNVGIGSLGIGTYLLNTNTITSTTNYSNFSFVNENQPESEEIIEVEAMVQDNNEEHLI
jgi:hypothetical protein